MISFKINGHRSLDNNWKSTAIVIVDNLITTQVIFNFLLVRGRFNLNFMSVHWIIFAALKIIFHPNSKQHNTNIMDNVTKSDTFLSWWYLKHFNFCIRNIIKGLLLRSPSIITLSVQLFPILDHNSDTEFWVKNNGIIC